MRKGKGIGVGIPIADIKERMREAMAAAVDAEFMPRGWSYRFVVDRVQAAAQSLSGDMQRMIWDALAERAQHVVREVVDEEIRKAVQKAIGTMRPEIQAAADAQTREAIG